MGFLEKIRKDIKKGYEEGLKAVKEGSMVVRKKAGELAEEGKKQLKLFELKQKIQGRLTDLGGMVYDLISSKKESPLQDTKVQSTISSIKKLEEEITVLKEKPEKPAGKKRTKKSLKKEVTKSKTKGAKTIKAKGKPVSEKK